ncbi:MAG: hypothetical protein KKF66_01055 [Actinobacteria bacterium]|nr:hypothetical protein [Actinomycetota bacterium]
MSALLKRIEDHSARVAVVGLGFVGLPLARRLKEAGFKVAGIDKYIKDDKRKEIEAEGIPVLRVFSGVSGSDIVVMMRITSKPAIWPASLVACRAASGK